MAKLIALQPINHDGKNYAVGEPLIVTVAAQVTQLVDAGAARVDGKKSKAEEAADAAAAALAAAAEADAQAIADAAAAASAQAAAAAQGQ